MLSFKLLSNLLVGVLCVVHQQRRSKQLPTIIWMFAWQHAKGARERIHTQIYVNWFAWQSGCVFWITRYTSNGSENGNDKTINFNRDYSFCSSFTSINSNFFLFVARVQAISKLMNFLIVKIVLRLCLIAKVVRRAPSHHRNKNWDNNYCDYFWVVVLLIIYYQRNNKKIARKFLTSFQFFLYGIWAFLN